MTMTDPIADMLTRIRNANSAQFDTVKMPGSKLKISLAQILEREGYITLEQDKTDRRVKYILTTPKLDKLLAAYLEVLRTSFGQLPRQAP